jgi:hypothetical protein
MALFEMKLVLATILSRWGLAPADRRAVKHGRRMFTAGPGENMRLVPLRERERATRVSRSGLLPTP